MRRRQFLSLLGGAAAMPLAARAQQQAKLSRIGFLRVGPPPPAWIAALRQGLREHGLIEGQHIEIEFGLAQSVAALVWPEASVAVIFAVMAVVLLVRPQGLFGIR